MERSSKSLTPDQLLRSFDEAPLSNFSPSQDSQSKFFSHPPLLPGEQIIGQADQVTCADTFNFTVKGVLHITKHRVIFAGSCDKPYYSGDQQSFDGDVDLEEIAKRGHYHQSRSNHSFLGHSVSDGYKNSVENEKKQDKWSRRKLSKIVRSSGAGVVRGMRNTQSMKGKKLAGSVHIAAFPDPSVKLHTLRPLVLSNLENVDHSYEVVASIPLSSISDVRKFSKKNLPKDKQVFLVDGFEILCSNIQSYRFCLSTQSNVDAEYVMKTVLSRLRTEFSRLFACRHKSAIMLPKSVDILEKKEAPNFYSFKVECKRLKVFETADWRQCPELPQQYPSETLISSVLSPNDVAEIAAFHRGKCFPALCWKHGKNGAVMLRSSATVNRRGLKDSRCKADEKYLSNIGSCSVALKNKLVVFTEQMRQTGGGLLNSSQQVTQMTGQLTPQEGETFYYPNTRFVYGDSIADVKAVRQSACKLQVHLCSRIDDSKWLSSLDDTDWLHQISELLQTATRISVAMDYDKSSVLISYEEGIDRTAQLSSLSQLLLDPYYRTLSGFQVLIQKEWLAFGHRFYDRTLLPQSSDEHGPVFLQWLDCVWQVHGQFPFSFQFNELLLQVIAEHLYSSRFGTFLANSRMELEKIEKDTCSLWTWLNVQTMSFPDKFINPRYNSDYAQRLRVLHPQYRIAHLKLWSPFFVNRYRHDHVHDALKAAQLEAMKLEQRYKDLIDVYSKLLNRLADVDSADCSSKVSFYSATLHAVPRVNSADQLGSIISDSSSSLNSADALSCTGASVGLDLAEEDSDFLASSMNSSCAKRRVTRSRSLDDMLHTNPARQRGQKITSLKRRVGSSKFYTEALSEKVTKEPASDLRNHQISEKYSSLMEYLDSTGIDYRSETHVTVLQSQCRGYMVKQGQVRKSWKKRWFVLDLTKTYLAYFETDKEESPKGAIKCNAITRVYERNSCGKGKRHFLFCVDTVDRTYTINAPSEQSMHIWITCLNLPPTAIEVP